MGGVGLEAESPNAERRDFMKSGVLVSTPVRFISGTRRERQTQVKESLKFKLHVHYLNMYMYLYVRFYSYNLALVNVNHLSTISATIQDNIL